VRLGRGRAFSTIGHCNPNRQNVNVAREVNLYIFEDTDIYLFDAFLTYEFGFHDFDLITQNGFQLFAIVAEPKLTSARKE